MRTTPKTTGWRDAWHVAVAVATLAAITWVFRGWWQHTNPTTAALIFLLVVLAVSVTSRLWAALAAALLADLALNYFFMPPFGTFAIADAENWVALGVFMVVSVTASSLATAARDRAIALQREELQSALLASLGHNLRTPLTAIRVAAGNLQSLPLPDHDRQEQLALIGMEVDRLNRLFEHVLEMARLDAGAVAPERSWVSPASLVEAARDQVGPALTSRLVNVAAASDVVVELDPRLTASALAQLLENAAQYADAGQPIDVAVAADAGRFVATVRDRGPGMSAADRSRAFEAFYRGSASGRRPSGTGMGLAIARGFMMAQGGDVRIEQPAGGGTAMMLELRAATRPLSAAAEE